MANETKWENISEQITLTSFAQKKNINLSISTSSNSGVLILPTNRKLVNDYPNNTIYSNLTKPLLGELQEKKIDTHLYDDGREKRTLILHYVDVILPPLLIFGTTIATQIVLGIIASWIYDEFIKSDPNSSPKISFEYAEADDKGNIIKWKKVEGPASDVYQLLLLDIRQGGHHTPKRPLDLKTLLTLENPGKDSRQNNGRIARGAGQKLIEQAEAKLKANKKGASEKLYRSSLEKLREAHLWEPENSSHINFLHSVGRRIHNLFGCTLEFRDDQYHVTCPVSLSHSRGGMSIGGIGLLKCSICYKNILECPHFFDKKYDGIRAKRYENRCNICATENCEHVDGTVYDGVKPIAIGTDLTLDHAAYVENPDDPLCVTYGFSLSRSDIEYSLAGNEKQYFSYGKTILFCHHCLECTGNITK